MNIQLKSLALCLSLGPICSSLASTVAIGNWTESGGDADNTFVANGTNGFTETFGTDTDGRLDAGATAAFVSDVTLSAAMSSLSFSFTVENLTTTTGGNNTFRVGFENDDAGTTSDATIHFVFGYGDPGNRRDARFAGNSNSNNEFSYGAAFDSSTLTGATTLFTGNTTNITVSLNFLGSAGAGLFDYQAVIDWDGIVNTSSTFTRNTDTWDKAYILTNNSVANTAGDTYTLSGTEVTTVPEPSSTLIMLLGGLSFSLRRRR